MEFEICNERLAMLIQQGHTESYEQLWNQTQKFLKLQALRYYTKRRFMFDNAGVVLEDCYQSCFLALSDAVKAFNESQGFSLLAYTTYPLQNRLNELIGANRGNKHEPLNECCSIDKPIVDKEGNETSLSDLLEDETAAAAFDKINHDIDHIPLAHTINEVMSSVLSENEQKVLQLYYWESKPIEEISELLSCDSKAIKSKALKQLFKDNTIRSLFFQETETAFYYGSLRLFRERQGSSVELAVE